MNYRAYNQEATYWGAPTPNGVGGFTFAAPVSLMVRWEERAEEYSDETGKTVVSSAIVFAKQDVQLGGYLLLGISSASNPTLVQGARVIRYFAKVPDIRGANYERRAYL